MDQELTKTLKDLYRIQKKIDDLNIEKSQLKKDVEVLIIENNMEGKKFAIGDRVISYGAKTQLQGISQKFLVDTLRKYYRNNEQEAENLLQFILDNREKTTKYQLDMVKSKPSN